MKRCRLGTVSAGCVGVVACGGGVVCLLIWPRKGLAVTRYRLLIPLRFTVLDLLLFTVHYTMWLHMVYLYICARQLGGAELTRPLTPQRQARSPRCQVELSASGIK